MGQGRINGRYTPECIEWVSARYTSGIPCSELAVIAQKEFPDLYGSFNRNCVLGIVHRSGAMRVKMSGRIVDVKDEFGGPSALITLPGPEWVIAAIGKPNIRGVMHV